MPMRRIDGITPRRRRPEPQKPSVAGLAACLALLELEARALGHPLAALLLAAAGEGLRERQENGRASFSEEKEAKRLLSIDPADSRGKPGPNG